MPAWSDVTAAFGYFSTLPIGDTTRDGPPKVATLGILPLVGVVVGALSGAGAALTAAANVRYAPAAAIICSVVLTGALHLDGYLDSCDALLASVTPERRREILKDPRHGTFALAGLLCLSVVWITALSLVAPMRLPGLLAWTAGTARLAAVTNAYRFPYGEARSLPSTLMLLTIGSVLCAVGAVAFGDVRLGVWPPIAVVFALLLGGVAGRRLGGTLAGDVYGAIICVLEVAGMTVVSLCR